MADIKVSFKDPFGTDVIQIIVPDKYMHLLPAFSFQLETMIRHEKEVRDEMRHPDLMGNIYPEI